jgi:hypothetical protein
MPGWINELADLVVRRVESGVKDHRRLSMTYARVERVLRYLVLFSASGYASIP